MQVRGLAEERKLSAWERFLDQRTVPQRFLIALAGIVTALGVVGGEESTRSRAGSGIPVSRKTAPR